MNARPLGQRRAATSARRGRTWRRRCSSGCRSPGRPRSGVPKMNGSTSIRCCAASSTTGSTRPIVVVAAAVVSIADQLRIVRSVPTLPVPMRSRSARRDWSAERLRRTLPAPWPWRYLPPRSTRSPAPGSRRRRSCSLCFNNFSTCLIRLPQPPTPVPVGGRGVPATNSPIGGRHQADLRPAGFGGDRRLSSPSSAEAKSCGCSAGDGRVAGPRPPCPRRPTRLPRPPPPLSPPPPAAVPPPHALDRDEAVEHRPRRSLRTGS